MGTLLDMAKAVLADHAAGWPLRTTTMHRLSAAVAAEEAALAAGIGARPCPFCGGAESSLEGNEDVCVICDECLAEGPVATIGCRGEDDGPIDLEAEAVALWNARAGGAT